MTGEALRTTFENYLAAFAESSTAEQERLLRLSLAEDVLFTNPGVEGRGLDNLLAHIAGFQNMFPGGYFRVNWFLHQHGQLLSEWTQYNRDGSEFVTAYSFARSNDEGRLAHLAGFWKSLPSIPQPTDHD